MRGHLSLLGKSMLIALAASAAALAPVGVATLFTSIAQSDPLLSVQSVSFMWMVALLGSFAIGLPVALLTHMLAGKHIVRFPSTLALIAGLAIIVMTIASFVVAGAAGIVYLGLPAAFACLTFAGLGWIWIIRPNREFPNA